MKIYSFLLFFVLLSSLFSSSQMQAQTAFESAHSYCVSTAGDDNNDGSLQHPWKTLDKLNHALLQPGDIVNLQGGDTLTGTLHLRLISGRQNAQIIIQSFGKGNALIIAKDSSAIVIDSCFYLVIDGIIAIGYGRKEGNTKDGFVIDNSEHIQVLNLTISGFQKAGLLIHDSKDINARNVFAHDNGFAGIYISGEYGDKIHCQNIHLTNCHAENNPGDPTNFGNHSGNGILAGFCTSVLIDSCIANNNGWDMPRKGNGPVGIWCFEADSVIIQHCISYENKTSEGGEDGGGYDLDGGTTNSIIQYCLSYSNHGSAFGIFQYDGASPWHDNIIRFCISEDDGNVSAAHANAYIWNSSHDSTQFANLLFYNNTLVNRKNNAAAYSSESEHHNFCFFNNIFVSSDALLRGDYHKDIFLGNDWWNLKYNFLVDGVSNFIQWAKHYNKEQLHGKLQGLNINPNFKAEDKPTIKTVSQMSSIYNYQFTALSSLRRAGIDLQSLLHINTGNVDFIGAPIQKPIIGACSK